MEPTPAIVTTDHILFVVSVILVCGSICGYLAKKIRVPDIALFLLVGILLGPAIGNVIHVDAASTLNQVILIFGAAYIIFDGGATVSVPVLGRVWISLIVLVTVGVGITALVVAATASYVFSIPFIDALLMGAVIASTDPATLVPVFQQVHIRERVSHLVMSESALNDPTGAILTLTLLALVMGAGHFSVGTATLQFIKEAGVGIIVGLVVGFLASILIAHKRYAYLRGYMKLMTLIVVAGGYLIALALGGSGFMVAFVIGLIMGSRGILGLGLPQHEELDLNEFVSTVSLIMRMLIFILLGSQVNFRLLNANWIGGIIVVAAFMLVARPLTVFVCCLPDRRAKWELKELLFMSWVRETGVIPSALAGLLLGLGAPHAQLIAAVTFMAVLITILVQATTTKWLGARLGLLIEPVVARGSMEFSGVTLKR